MTATPHLVVFTGSGISVESGIKTFRASDGLWEEHPVEEVATPEGWRHDPERVLTFITSAAIKSAKPNPTLPTRRSPPWSRMASRSALLPKISMTCTNGPVPVTCCIYTARFSRPAPRWMDGCATRCPRAALPLATCAIRAASCAPTWCGSANQCRCSRMPARSQARQTFLVVGTSLAVMPAASLLSYIELDTPCALVDPDADTLTPAGVLAINTTAGEGVPALVNQWRKQGNLVLP